MKKGLLYISIIISLNGCNFMAENKKTIPNDYQIIEPYKTDKTNIFNNTLSVYIKNALKNTGYIPADRRKMLDETANYIFTQKINGEPANLLYICTHNSRRSHFSQIWAATAAKYFKIDWINTYSGGTETTAFNPRAVAAIERAGFIVENPGGSNPKYHVKISDNDPGILCYSKKYTEETNHLASFAAVITCTQADESCPIIHGATNRISLPYDDPKAFDNMPEENGQYDERCFQIATEMLYVMNKVLELAK